MKKKTSYAQEIKAMAKAHGKDVMPETKLYKPRQKRTYKRTKEKNDMAEKRLEREIIWRLNMIDNVEATKAGEISTYNSNLIMAGLSDIIVFIKDYGVVFMEVKTKKGQQRKSQKEFEQICLECGLQYVLVRSVSYAVHYINDLKNNV